MRKIAACGLALATAFLLSACAPSVMVQQDPAVNLPGPATWAWDKSEPSPVAASPAPAPADTATPRATISSGPYPVMPPPAPATPPPANSDRLPGDDNPHVNNEIISSMLNTAITLGMQKRGYAETPADNAAWLVSYNIGLQKKTSVVQEPLNYPPRLICTRYRGCFYDDFGWWYGGPLYVTRTVRFDESTIMINLRDAKTHKLVWRGFLSQEVNLGKDLQAGKLQQAVDAVLGKLPGVGGTK